MNKLPWLLAGLLLVGCSVYQKRVTYQNISHSYDQLSKQPLTDMQDSVLFALNMISKERDTYLSYDRSTNWAIEAMTLLKSKEKTLPEQTYDSLAQVFFETLTDQKITYKQLLKDIEEFTARDSWLQSKALYDSIKHLCGIYKRSYRAEFDSMASFFAIQSIKARQLPDSLEVSIKFAINSNEEKLGIRPVYLFPQLDHPFPLFRGTLGFDLRDAKQDTVIQVRSAKRRIHSEDNPGTRQWNDELFANAELWSMRITDPSDSSGYRDLYGASNTVIKGIDDMFQSSSRCSYLYLQPNARELHKLVKKADSLADEQSKFLSNHYNYIVRTFKFGRTLLK